MARRYHKKIDWSWLRAIAESGLNASNKFAVAVEIDGKLDWIEGGMYHDNYRFWIHGEGLPKASKNQSLLLRLSSQKDPLRSKAQAAQYLQREAHTLQALKAAGFDFDAPEFICMAGPDAAGPLALIETWVWGMSLEYYKNSIYRNRTIPTIAEVAAAVHRLPPGLFNHLPACGDSRAHILNTLGRLSPELFTRFRAARTARDWILARLPDNRPATVLHGDLLPQNIICGEDDSVWKVTVIDWEFAEIGDPAYDLAIVTRGDRKLLGIDNGLKHLLEAYRKAAAGIDLTLADVRIHELLLFMNWLWSASEDRRRGKIEGHGPDHYTQRLESLLRRAQKGE